MKSHGKHMLGTGCYIGIPKVHSLSFFIKDSSIMRTPRQLVPPRKARLTPKSVETHAVAARRTGLRDGELDRPKNAGGNEISEALEQQRDFLRWFHGSCVVDAHGKPMVMYHGTTADIGAFDHRQVIAGFHFGTANQASMRVLGESGGNLIPAYLNIRSPRRSRDMGGNWAGKIRAAIGAGHDGIIYLNRYEGIPLEAFQRAVQQIAKERGGEPDFSWLDTLSDKEFRRYVPEATDSYIVFEPAQIMPAIGDCYETQSDSKSTLVADSSEHKPEV